MLKYVTSINKKYQFQSPPITENEKIKIVISKQRNTNSHFNEVSSDTFYFPCKKSRFRPIAIEEYQPEYEDITDRKIVSHFLPADEEETQLSPFFPKFINRVETKDVATQTETCDISPVNYVYSFYIEVIPILERLVGYTIELAMTEIECEEEVILRRKANKRFNEIVAPERVEVNRRLEETYRRTEEIRRRSVEITEKEKYEQMKLEENMRKQQAESEIWEIINRSIEKISRNKMSQIEQIIEDDVQENFLPFLITTAYKCPILFSEVKARCCVDGIIRDACDQRR